MTNTVHCVHKSTRIRSLPCRSSTSVQSALLLKEMKFVLMLDGSAGCYKTSATNEIGKHPSIQIIHTDIINLREKYHVYTKGTNMGYNTVAWYCEYKMNKFKTDPNEEKTLAITDRSPYAPFVYAAYFDTQRPTVEEFESLIPEWFKEYGQENYVLFLIDTDIETCLKRIKTRGLFDIAFANEEYWEIQNQYFSTLAKVCNLEVIDVKGMTPTQVINKIKKKIETFTKGEILFS